jgi:hypothetical protein
MEDDAWSDVQSREDAARLLAELDHFHDAAVVSAVWSSGESLGADCFLSLGRGGTLTLRVVSQNRHVNPVELQFVTITRFNFKDDLDVDGEFELPGDAITAKFLQWEVVSKRLEWRRLPRPLLRRDQEAELGD